MSNYTLPRRRYASKKGVKAFSERSGQPFRLDQMLREPGTGLLVHRSENDGKWNITEAFKLPIVPPDAQQLEYVSAKPDTVIDTEVNIEDFIFD